MLKIKKVTRFRPQQGLTIMNSYGKVIMDCELQAFPSPTGVNYYEFYGLMLPSVSQILFPSPTGVNYYELNGKIGTTGNQFEVGFRPQQGLTIMNSLPTKP